MKRSNNGVILLLGCLLVSLAAIILIFSSLNRESDHDLYLRDIEEVELVQNKMIETDFEAQLSAALKNEGYNPTGSYSYTIFNMSKKELTIVLHGIDTSRKKAEKYIQELTDNLSTSIGLGTFEVTVLEDKD